MLFTDGAVTPEPDTTCENEVWMVASTARSTGPFLCVSHERIMIISDHVPASFGILHQVGYR